MPSAPSSAALPPTTSAAVAPASEDPLIPIPTAWKRRPSMSAPCPRRASARRESHNPGSSTLRAASACVSRRMALPEVSMTASNLRGTCRAASGRPMRQGPRRMEPCLPPSPHVPTERQSKACPRARKTHSRAHLHEGSTTSPARSSSRHSRAASAAPRPSRLSGLRSTACPWRGGAPWTAMGCGRRGAPGPRLSNEEKDCVGTCSDMRLDLATRGSAARPSWSVAPTALERRTRDSAVDGSGCTWRPSRLSTEARRDSTEALGNR
mmetsp:Transcript_22064/g.68743  ORF Transcript_22064/g.68743 Transcript_22064/m.68743 type:complete len:266 (-) Transcript_22064:137-934(-)